MVLEPETGHLAGGDVGIGRMAEPAAIFELIERIVRGYRGPLSDAISSSARAGPAKRSTRYA